MTSLANNRIAAQPLCVVTVRYAPPAPIPDAASCFEAQIDRPGKPPIYLHAGALDRLMGFVSAAVIR